MIIPLAIVGVAGIGYWLYKIKNPPVNIALSTAINAPVSPTGIQVIPVSTLSIVDTNAAAKLTNADTLVKVQLGDDTYLVAPDYIGPIGIGAAKSLAISLGFDLPTPALVDAIFRASDLKIVPMPRAQNIISAAVYADQKAKIADAIGGRTFKLVSGGFKDVVNQPGQLPGLYGWHVANGVKGPGGVPLLNPVTPGPDKVIQPPSGGAHGQFYEDYSQGCRLVKKIPKQTV